MASMKKRPGTSHLRGKNALLPKVFQATFDTHEQAIQYGEQLERLLAHAIGPADSLADRPCQLFPRMALRVARAWTIQAVRPVNGHCIVAYLRHDRGPVPDVNVRDTFRSGLEPVGTGRGSAVRRRRRNDGAGVSAIVVAIRGFGAV